MKVFRFFLFIAAISMLIILLSSPLSICSNEKQGLPLYVYLEVHLDNPNYPDKNTIEDVSKTLRKIAAITEKHDMRATFLTRPQYAEASFKYGDSTLKDLQRRGHDIGIHTHLYPHETDSFAEGFNALKALGISNIISANPGFILRPQMPFEVKNQMARNFKKTLEEMKEKGIKIYSGSFGQGSYSPYSPFRPAEGYYYPDPSGVREIKTSTTGPFVALHGVPAGPYMWKKPEGVSPHDLTRSQGFDRQPPFDPLEPQGMQNPSVWKEIQEYEIIDAVKPKLEKALRDKAEYYPFAFNFFPVAIHEIEFIGQKIVDGKKLPVYNKDNKAFIALDRFLTEIIDPLIKEKRIQWVTMAELYYKYVEFEKRNLR